jgi:multidrug resistance efflux pump
MSPSEYISRRPTASADPADASTPDDDAARAAPEPDEPEQAVAPDAPATDWSVEDMPHDTSAAETEHVSEPAQDQLQDDVQGQDHENDRTESGFDHVDEEALDEQFRDAEAPDMTDLWAMRQSLSQADPSPGVPPRGSAATAEDLWAEPRQDDEPLDLPHASRSQERAAEAEALQRLVRLNEELRARAYPEAAPPLSEEEPLAPDTQPFWSRLSLPSGRIVKSILALAVVIALAWMPVSRLLSLTSAEATINARLVNIRAPIDGTVSVVAPSIAVGTRVEPGETLLQVTNARADRQRLDDTRREIERLGSESASLELRLKELESVESDLVARRDAFQNGRIRQLEARAGELTSEIKGAEARLADAQKALGRSKQLKAEGFETTAGLLHAERDVQVANSEVEAARKRQQGNQVELDGARKGFFIGDSYNDRPRSAQYLDEVRQQIADLSSQLDERQSRTAYLKEELADEERGFARRSETNVTAMVSGRIWQLLTADGEQVQEGQDLLRVLDCGGAAVTATVSESDYNQLWVGQPATFQLRGESREYPGTVVALTGLTPAGSNFAIEQSALTREPYHVTIAVPGLAALQECNVGRTGRVTFDTSATPASASSAATAKVAPSAGPVSGTP